MIKFHKSVTGESHLISINLNYTTESWGGAKPYALSMAYSYDGLGRMKNAESQGDDDGPRLCETVDVDLDANVVGVMRRYNVLLAQDAVMTMGGGKVVTVNDASAPYYADYVGRFPDGSYTLAYDRNGRLTTDETRQIKAITYHKYIDRPNRITMDNGDYAVSNYLPDRTLTRRTFYSKRIETVTKVTADGDTIVRNVTRTTSNMHDYMGSFWTVRGETKARRVVTSAGYVDLTTGKRYWYVTNRQGSTMAVVDETGAVVQRNGYYPSGTPFVLPSEIGTTPAPSMTAVTDQLHIGNRWLSHSGLNMYDNTARLHDPLLMRFAAPDPLADKYPDFSPWSHCAGNSINLIDPSGRTIVADEWCQQGILDGLCEYESKYVSFDANGVLDDGLLSQCNSQSVVFTALRTLSSNKTNFIMEGVYECVVKDIQREMGKIRGKDLTGQVLAPGFADAPSPDNNVYIYK